MERMFHNETRRRQNIRKREKKFKSFLHDMALEFFSIVIKYFFSEFCVSIPNFLAFFRSLFLQEN